jgi:hypothetical protein
MRGLSSTNLWDSICRGSNQTLVLASSIPMQMSRELGFDALGGLNRDNEVAGQICDSGNYSRATESVPSGTSGELGWRGGAGTKQGFWEGITYQPLQASESLMRAQPYCLYNDCPSAANEGR